MNAITHTFHSALPISPRTFLVLQITAVPLQDAEETQAFLTIQFPVCLPSTILQPFLPKNTVVAHYISIEYIRVLSEVKLSNRANPLERWVGAKKQIEWNMATASDGGGWIPGFVQRSSILGGVPKVIVKDVGLFMKWVAEKRRQAAG